MIARLGRSCAEPAATDGGYQERLYLSSDGLSLYYREYGPPLSDLPAVLCLPGLTRNSRDFHRLAGTLGKTRRVICPDYRGRGRSQYDRRWWNYHFATYAEDIRHLLCVAGIHSAVAIGTSMGGLLAMQLAVTAPSTIKAAVLNDIGPELSVGGFDSIMRYMKDDRPVADWDAAVAGLRATFPDLPARNDDDWMEIARGTYRESDGGLLVPDWDAAVLKLVAKVPIERIDMWPMFRALGGRPVIALRGDRSSILSEPVFRRMDATLDRITCITIAGVGHAPSLGEPQALDAIHDLLECL